jgi:tetratricopeptide (TPR) repeat protein
MVIDKSQAEAVTGEEAEPDRGPYPRRESLHLALLLLLAIVFFVGVSGLSRIYHAQQELLGNRWFTRGEEDLKEQHFDRAASEFRTALLYSRDNYDYRLNLAEALVGLKRNGEAYAYLINLWEREPENGLVNLELARMAAQKRDTEQALRYYHNAIYAIWPGDQEEQRRNARLELIEFLLSINARTQAQSEVIALAASLDDDPSEDARVGDLFLRVQDYEHALAEYRLSLKAERHDSAALAGAGEAAFELGRYELAQRYLRAEATENAGDTQSAMRLQTAELVLKMDPFQRQLSVAERNRIVMEAFAVAGQRLKECAADGKSTASLQNLSDEWAKMNGQIDELHLRRDPDLVEAAMNSVFSIERQTSSLCGPPSGPDMALLLIAKLHEGN